MRGPGLRSGAAVALALIALVRGASAEREADLFDLPLEELVATQVISVTGRASDWFSTPAAVHVISGDDLRRSGHLSLVEALRMVPGFYVGRIDASRWSTGVRGFADGFYPHLQALIDGREIYSELFSGVYWDVQTPLLEDVESIEVIRGPGATLWGANAVNGVLNVKTRSARDSHGLYLSGGGGSELQAFGMGRYGVALGEQASLRGWARFVQRDGSQARRGGSLKDEWSILRGGLRLDAGLAPGLELMAQGQAYVAPTFEQVRGVPESPNGQQRGDNDAYGGHGLLRFDYDLGSARGLDAQRLSLRVYYDLHARENVNGFAQRNQTADVDFQHHLTLGRRHEIVWGAGYRFRRTETRAATPTAPPLALRPANRQSELTTFFFQDTITLVEDRLFLMLGSKFEHNSWTGFEVQPSGRLWWTPSPRHTLWAAISRPVRTPSLVEQFLVIDVAPGQTLRGSRRLGAEETLAYEAGYRVRPSDALVLDFAAFFFDYDELIEIVPVAPGELRFDNGSRAHTMGIEVAARWQPCARWQLAASYSYLHVDATSLPPTSEREDRDPENMFQLRSYLDVTETLEANAALYFVDSIARFDRVPAYARLDLGLSWRPVPELELSVWGQNLAGTHAESGEVFMPVPTAKVEPSVYGRVSLRY